MAKVQVLSGPHRSTRARAIDTMFLSPWGDALLIVPTRRAADLRMQALLGESGRSAIWGTPVLTFQDFVEGLLSGTRYEFHRIGAFEQRLILERCITTLLDENRLEELGETAQTEGFLSHMLGVIGRLKQAAIDPPSFSAKVAKRSRARALDRAVARIYASYQDTLRAEEVYDLQGMYWMGNLACSEGQPKILVGVESLLLDGFDDFTPSEFSLIQSVEPYVNQLVFGLNYGTLPGQRDLYAVPRETAKAIRAQFPGATEKTLEEETCQTSTHFVARHLFWRDKPDTATHYPLDLDFITGHGSIHELETVARRIKRLVVEDGIELDTIAVVHRNIGEVAGALREIFDEFGIPAVIQSPRTLAETSLANFVLQLLCAIEDWKREDVVDVLTSPWFQFVESLDTEHRSAAPLLARRAQVISGLKQWREGLNRLAQRIGEQKGRNIESLLYTLPDAGKACANLIRHVEALDRLSRSVPKTATQADFAGAITAVLDSLALAHCAEDPADAAESTAPKALRRLLGSFAVLGGGDSRRLTRKEFTNRLRRWMQGTHLDVPQPALGVFCSDMERLRHLEFDYVFFVGVNEGTVPRPPSTNAIYTDTDIDDLYSVGIRLERATEHVRREMLLFQRMFTVARKHLTISWHAVSRTGQAKERSPFLADVTELAWDVPTSRVTEQTEVIAPKIEQVASLRDLRNAVFAWMPPAVRDANPALERARTGALIEVERQRASAFGPHDGQIESPAMLKNLRIRFDAGHTFSVNQFETYTSCPFRFFMERILNIREEEDPDEAFDHRVRGSILHSVLEDFHRGNKGKTFREVGNLSAKSALRTITVERFKEQAWKSSNTSQGVIGVEQARMIAKLERYVDIEIERDVTGWKPTFFEVSFGDVPRPTPEDISTTEPFVLETGEGPVRFSGQIDRVDESSEGLRIIDYKTNVRIEQKEIKSGQSIQLTIYALALEGFLQAEHECIEGLFLQPGSKKKLEGLAKSKGKPPWDERKQIAIEAIEKAVRGIRAGVFHPTRDDDSCNYCPKARICRYEASRMQRKAGASPTS